MKSELSKRLMSSMVLIPVVFYCIMSGSYYFNFLIITSFLISIFEWNSMNKRKLYSTIGLIFLFISYLTIFLIRNNFGEQSLYFFLVITLTCVSTDLGGYIFGKIFGGPKLTKLSPKKTYSGMIGAFVFSIVVLILFNKYNFISDYYSNKTNINFIFVILIISSVSQIGDIIVSYFKRKAKIKHTGRIIPGHGGLLDRTDGMIFAFPISYLLLTLKFL
tara:strand:- start:4329 stop:4982 length:654 start_codon:yes stop_codon:yes gene_type:complete